MYDRVQRLHIFHNALHLGRIATSPAFDHQQRFVQLRLPGHLYRLSVQIRPFSLPCREQLLDHRIVNDPDMRFGVNEQRERNARMREAVDEI